MHRVELNSRGIPTIVERFDSDQVFVCAETYPTRTDVVSAIDNWSVDNGMGRWTADPDKMQLLYYREIQRDADENDGILMLRDKSDKESRFSSPWWIIDFESIRVSHVQ